MTKSELENLLNETDLSVLSIGTARKRCSWKGKRD